VNIFQKQLCAQSKHALEQLIHRRPYSLLALIVATFLVYSPALQGEFLWDDLYLVGENPFFKSPIFALEVFRHFLYLDSFSVYYRPLQNLSYMLDYLLWGTNPFGYHLSNVALHGISGCLLYCLCRTLLPRLIPNFSRFTIVAFVAALIWTIHPVHNAAVAYISGRADSLASVFALAGWLLYLRAREASQNLRYALYLLASICALAALCSKEVGLVWIALFACYALVFEPKSDLRHRIWLTSTLISISLIYVLLRCLPHSREYPVIASEPFASRILLMMRALGDYLGLIVFPLKLYMERSISGDAMGAFGWQESVRPDYLSVIGLCGIILVVWCCVRHSAQQRLFCFGALWFAIGFIPISNLFPLNAQVAEHWIYIPSFGLILLTTAFCLSVSRAWQPAIVIGLCLAVPALGARTMFRAADWGDAEVFHARTIRDGGSSPRILANLAQIYSARGEHAKAEPILRETLRRYPDYVPARINLGICLLNLHKSAEAERLLQFNRDTAEKLAATFPHTWSAALNLAQSRYLKNEVHETFTILDEAIAHHPHVWDLVQLKCQILQQRNDGPAAIASAASFVRRNWWHYNARVALGKLQAAAGDGEAAIKSLRYAAKLDVRNSEPLSLIAYIQMNSQKFEDARRSQLAAVRRSPDQPRQYLFLASILEKLNRHEEARGATRKAQSLRDSIAVIQ
jgi:protein O-mannosyl-transferase